MLHVCTSFHLRNSSEYKQVENVNGGGWNIYLCRWISWDHCIRIVHFDPFGGLEAPKAGLGGEEGVLVGCNAEILLLIILRQWIRNHGVVFISLKGKIKISNQRKHLNGKARVEKLNSFQLKVIHPITNYLIILKLCFKPINHWGFGMNWCDLFNHIELKWILSLFYQTLNNKYV